MPTTNELTQYSLERLADKDLLFLIQSYANKRNDHEHVRDLIENDADIIGMMVESDRVFEKLMDQSTAVHNISPFFFFTLLLRRSTIELQKRPDQLEEALDELNRRKPVIPWGRERAIKLLRDATMAEYLANMISVFTCSSRMFKVQDGDSESYYYLFDLIETLQKSDPVRQYKIYCHIGNYSLFLTGLFPEFVEHQYRYRRQLVDDHFYVGFGKTYYGLASDHHMARYNELATVFSRLSTGFEIFKHLLNYMAFRYLRPSQVN